MLVPRLRRREEVPASRHQAEGKEIRQWVEEGGAIRVWELEGSLCNQECSPSARRTPWAGQIRKETNKDHGAHTEPSLRGRVLHSRPQTASFWWLQFQVTVYRVQRGHLGRLPGGSGRSVHMATFLAFPSSLGSSLSSSSSPRFFLPSFAALLPFFLSSSFLSLLPSSLWYMS